MARVRRSYKILRNGRHVGTANFFGKTVKAAESEAKKYARQIGAKIAGKGRRRNVAAGFMDEFGEFHPIRASYDYSRKRAGEGGKAKSRRKTRKRR